MGELNNIDDSFNPYVGPRTFEEADRTYFFGREREARDLLSFVISEQLVLFYAQSGAGKSSLINARFVPDLRVEGFDVLPIGRVGGSLPENIDIVRNIFVFNLLLSLEQDRADPSDLTNTTLAEYLDKIKNPKIHMAAEPARVLIIDQFEEIVTTHLGRWQERQSFFGQLRRAMDNDPLLWVVLTIREDHIAAIEPYTYIFPDKLRARFHMRRMQVEAALSAIKQPASISGKLFESGVAESLVDNLRQIRVRDQNIPVPDEPVQREPILGEYVEPVQLQVVCYQLWENLKRRPVNKITQKDLDELGDVDTALGHFYESAIRVAATGSEEPEAKLRRWFENKLITEAGMRGTVSQGVEVTAELDNQAVQILANQYLLRADRRAGSIWYELIHDRFVDPILKANHAWRLQQSLVYQAAEEWERSGRKRENLYQGEQLKEALANVDLASQDHLLQEFLKASEESQSQRELQELAQRMAVERRTSQRLRWLTIALIVVSLLAIGLAGLAFRQGAVARANEAKALRNAELAVSEQQTAVAGSTEVAKAYEIAEASLATQAASLELQLSASSSLTSTSTTPNAEAIATTAAIETQLMEIRATQTAVVTLPPAFDPDLIAMYTLENNAEDKTEKNNDITLQNAPFQEDGGVYCNGVYAGDNRCLIMTPQLNSFDYDSFSISMQFKVTEFKTQPVFVGGNGWRWIGYYLNDDGTVSLLYNNSNREACGGEYELNKWHTADVTYDGKEARLYLDSFLRCTIPFDLEHGNDKNVTTSNFSNGQAFKGIIRELRIYNKVISPLNIEPLSQRDPRWSNLRLGQAGSTRTIGDWGPLLVSMTMLANSFDKDITPSDLNASFIRQGGYLDTNLLKWNALSNVYSDIIYMGKISDQTELLIRIDESLANGNPVIAQVDFTPDTPYDDDDQHWVLIVRKDGDDYRINDPWLYPAEESSLIDQYGRPSELDEPVVLSAIFYRSISQ